MLILLNTEVFFTKKYLISVKKSGRTNELERPLHLKLTK